MKTVKGFRLDMLNNIDKFSDFWIKNQKQSPEDFPQGLSDEEWYEQFLHWMSSNTE